MLETIFFSTIYIICCDFCIIKIMLMVDLGECNITLITITHMHSCEKKYLFCNTSKVTLFSFTDAILIVDFVEEEMSF